MMEEARKAEGLSGVLYETVAPDAFVNRQADLLVMSVTLEGDWWAAHLLPAIGPTETFENLYRRRRSGFT